MAKKRITDLFGKFTVGQQTVAEVVATSQNMSALCSCFSMVFFPFFFGVAGIIGIPGTTGFAVAAGALLIVAAEIFAFPFLFLLIYTYYGLIEQL